MAPKFRGRSEEWLDDERTQRRRTGAQKKTSKEKKSVAPYDANGTVVEVYPKQCRILGDDGQDLLCSYRRATLLGVGQEELRERTPVAVGDRVLISVLSPGSGVVEGACERTTWLLRPAPDRQDKAVHVIAANVELMLIVASPVEPDFSAGMVDRFLIAASLGGIKPLICINKIDLAVQQAPEEQPWSRYSELGVSVFEVSAKKDLGVSELKAALEGNSVVFCGRSGVGKTSLLRALTGREIGKIGEVSSTTGKGKHTTTVSTLLPIPGGAKWVDTPGVREFGLAGIEPETLADYFPEFAQLGCRARGCCHQDEEACVARDLWRYPSYRRILESLIAGEY